MTGRTYLSWVLGCLCVWGAADARAEVEVEVGAEDGTVYVDARAPGLFGPGLDEALRSGLPAKVSVELVLFEERSAIWDREVARGEWAVRVVFDLLDEVYSVVDASGEVVLEVDDLAGVEEYVGGVEFWPLCPLETLATGRTHYLGARFVVEPLSLDEVRDLERWLRGNVRSGDRWRDVPAQLVGVLRNRLGLGVRSERGRSQTFLPARLPSPD